MDIFTTALTRVLQTPIKPVRLRVKPLSKEPSLNKLTDDPDHLENHDQYVNLSKDHSEKIPNSKKAALTTEYSSDKVKLVSKKELKEIITKQNLIPKSS